MSTSLRRVLDGGVVSPVHLGSVLRLHRPAVPLEPPVQVLERLRPRRDVLALPEVARVRVLHLQRHIGQLRLPPAARVVRGARRAAARRSVVLPPLAAPLLPALALLALARSTRARRRCGRGRDEKARIASRRIRATWVFQLHEHQALQLLP